MLKLYKDLAFAALKNPANPFPETGIVGEIHCLDDEELKVFSELLLKEFIKVGNAAFIKDHSVLPVFPTAQIKKHFEIKDND